MNLVPLNLFNYTHNTPQFSTYYRVADHVVDLGLVTVLVTGSAGLAGRTTAVLVQCAMHTQVATCHQNSRQTGVHEIGHPVKGESCSQ